MGTATCSWAFHPHLELGANTAINKTPITTNETVVMFLRHMGSPLKPDLGGQGHYLPDRPTGSVKGV